MLDKARVKKQAKKKKNESQREQNLNTDNNKSLGTSVERKNKLCFTISESLVLFI